MLDRLRRRTALTIRRRPLLPFLLAATVMGNLVVATFDKEEAAISYVIAEAGLLGVWASQLRRGWQGRCLITMAGIAVISLTCLIQASEAYSEVVTVLTIYATAVGFVGAAFRFGGRAANRRWPREQVQFSIRGVLATTTLVAVALALLRYADIPSDPPLLLAIAFAVWGSLPLTTLFIVRRVTNPLVAFAIIMLMSLLVGWWFDTMFSYFNTRYLRWILLQGIVYAFWFLGLRSRLRTAEGDRS